MGERETASKSLFFVQTKKRDFLYLIAEHFMREPSGYHASCNYEETMMNQFYEALGTVIDPRYITVKSGISYLSAARAVALAKRPDIRFVEFEGSGACLPLFDGGVVAVDIPLPNDILQRTWLPVMDAGNRPIPFDRITSVDVYNAQQRCMVKAIAMTLGVGMSVYLQDEGDGAKSVKRLGVTPSTDLAAVEALVGRLDETGVPYVGWAPALAASRTVYPVLHWSLVMQDGKPYMETNGGVFVGVDLQVGAEQKRLWLPMFEGDLDPIQISKATVMGWNKTAMRTLAKAVAYTTGYGLEVYAEDFGHISQPTRTVPSSAPKEEKSSQEQKPAQQAPVATQDAPAAASSQDSASDSLTRFRAVIAKRFAVQGMAGVCGLFEALVNSTKYEEADKPACLMELTSYIAGGIAPDQTFNAVALLEDIERYKVGKLFAGSAALAQVGQRLTAACLGRTVDDEGAFTQVGNLLVEAELIKKEQLLSVAETSGIPEAAVALLDECVIPF